MVKLFLTGSNHSEDYTCEEEFCWQIRNLRKTGNPLSPWGHVSSFSKDLLFKLLMLSQKKEGREGGRKKEGKDRSDKTSSQEKRVFALWCWLQPSVQGVKATETWDCCSLYSWGADDGWILVCSAHFLPFTYPEPNSREWCCSLLGCINQHNQDDPPTDGPTRKSDPGSSSLALLPQVILQRVSLPQLNWPRQWGCGACL